MVPPEVGRKAEYRARIGDSNPIPGSPVALARLMLGHRLAPAGPRPQRQLCRVGRLRRALHVRQNPRNDLRLLDAADDLERFEHEVRRAVAIRGLERVAHLAG